jgi:hypothetical protein
MEFLLIPRSSSGAAAVTGPARGRNRRQPSWRAAGIGAGGGPGTVRERRGAAKACGYFHLLNS